jgi:hypothetical protein
MVKNSPNGNKIHEMAIKFTKGPLNKKIPFQGIPKYLSKLGFFCTNVCIPSGNPVSNYFFALKVYE